MPKSGNGGSFLDFTHVRGKSAAILLKNGSTASSADQRASPAAVNIAPASRRRSADLPDERAVSRHGHRFRFRQNAIPAAVIPLPPSRRLGKIHIHAAGRMWSLSSAVRADFQNLNDPLPPQGGSFLTFLKLCF